MTSETYSWHTDSTSTTCLRWQQPASCHFQKFYQICSTWSLKIFVIALLWRHDRQTSKWVILIWVKLIFRWVSESFRLNLTSTEFPAMKIYIFLELWVCVVTLVQLVKLLIPLMSLISTVAWASSSRDSSSVVPVRAAWCRAEKLWQDKEGEQVERGVKGEQ